MGTNWGRDQMNDPMWADYAASLREPTTTPRMRLWRFAAGLRFLPISFRARLTDLVATSFRNIDLEPFGNLVVYSICGAALGYLVWQMARAGWILR